MVEKIRKGYKQTEVGVIPEDWKLISYDEIFDFLPTATYSRAELSENDEIKYVHYGDIHTKCNNFLDCDKIELPTIKKEQQKEYSLLKDGDLLIVDASEDYEGVGKSVEIKNLKNKKAISGLHTFLLRDRNNTFVNGFKGYIHSNKFVKKQMDTLATGLKVYGVSKTYLKTIKIPLPPTKSEQTAIAAALSDTDSLIRSLEKFIAKKRAIKQGAMQVLLSESGFTGLEDFQDKNKAGKGVSSGKWEVKKLGDLISLVIDNRGKTPPYSTNEAVELIETVSINNNYRFPIYENVTKYVSKFTFSHWFRNHPVKNDLLISTVGEYSGSSAFMSESRGTIAQNLIAIRIKNAEPIFIFYWTRSNYYNDQLKAVMMNHAQPSLRVPWLLNFKISLPKNRDEQTRIAQILSDMDSEIESLEKKLEKYKMIKHGMMQELLTGKIRLNQDSQD
ncbi:MAG: restriction endonuclease subunit S [Spirochaetes bacterium]|nr:restriction endonuclease subunit S [Spirochaetota bacterium]